MIQTDPKSVKWPQILPGLRATVNILFIPTRPNLKLFLTPPLMPTLLYIFPSSLNSLPPLWSPAHDKHSMYWILKEYAYTHLNMPHLTVQQQAVSNGLLEQLTAPFTFHKRHNPVALDWIWLSEHAPFNGFTNSTEPLGGRRDHLSEYSPDPPSENGVPPY